MGNRVLSNEEKIKFIERKLDEIFSKFENVDLENLTLYAVVYKNTIKFVSIELKKEVQELIYKYNDLISIKINNEANNPIVKIKSK